MRLIWNKILLKLIIILLTLLTYIYLTIQELCMELIRRIKENEKRKSTEIDSSRKSAGISRQEWQMKKYINEYSHIQRMGEDRLPRKFWTGYNIEECRQGSKWHFLRIYLSLRGEDVILDEKLRPESR